MPNLGDGLFFQPSAIDNSSTGQKDCAMRKCAEIAHGTAGARIFRWSQRLGWPRLLLALLVIGAFWPIFDNDFISLRRLFLYRLQ